MPTPTSTNKVECKGCRRHWFTAEQIASVRALDTTVECTRCASQTGICALCDQPEHIYSTHTVMPRAVVGASKALRFSSACYQKLFGICSDCRGVLVLDAGHALATAYVLPGTARAPGDPTSAPSLCVPCAEERKKPCGVCASTEKICGFLIRTTWEGAIHRKTKVAACTACWSDRVVCSACTQTTPGFGAVYSNDDVYVICAGCWVIYQFCTECESRVVSRQAPNCGQCNTAIMQYSERAERRLGFFGHPPAHEKCLKQERRGPHKCLPGCRFDGFYFGVELEVDADNASAAIALAIKAKKLFSKRAIMKRDGSVPFGFEIVTAPATLTEHRRFWKPFFDWTGGGHTQDGYTHIPLMAQKAKGVNCGLHVHVSRGPMSTFQIAKILQFVHSPDNREFIEFMSGRPPGHYQDFLRDKCIWKGPQEVESWTGLNGGTASHAVRKGGSRADFYTPRRDHGSRYTAVNLTNPHTIEFRIFKATLVPTTFWARVEFVAALVAYTRPGVASIQEMTVPAFSAWLEERRANVCTNGCTDCFDYKHLTDHMAKGGFVAPETPLPAADIQITSPTVGLANNRTRKLRRGYRSR